MDMILSLVAVCFLVGSYRTLVLEPEDQQHGLVMPIVVLACLWTFAVIKSCHVSSCFTIPLSLFVNVFVWLSLRTDEMN